MQEYQKRYERIISEAEKKRSEGSEEHESSFNCREKLDELMRGLQASTTMLKDEGEVMTYLNDNQAAIIETLRGIMGSPMSGDEEEAMVRRVVEMTIYQRRYLQSATLVLSTPKKAEPQESNLPMQQDATTAMLAKLLQQMTDVQQAQLEIQKKDNERKQAKHDRMTVFAQQAGGVQKSMQPLAFHVALKKSIEEATVYELFKYVEGVMKFVETIDSINAMPINDMLKKLYLFTFARGHISEEEAVTHIAYQNYLNNRKLSTLEQETSPPDVCELDHSQHRLNEQMYVWVISLFDQRSPEIKQALNRVKIHPELGTYLEFLLYLFHTKSKSPLRMWSETEKNMAILEKTLSLNIAETPMATVRDNFQCWLEEREKMELLSWQVTVTRIYRYAVRLDSKRGVQYLEQQVIDFLASAQDSNKVVTPNVKLWSKGLMDIVEQEKDFKEAKKDFRRLSVEQMEKIEAKQKIEAKHVQQVVKDKDKKHCIDCNQVFKGPASWKRCRECHADSRKTKGDRNMKAANAVKMDKDKTSSMSEDSDDEDFTSDNLIDTYGGRQSDGEPVLTVSVHKDYKDVKARVSDTTINAVIGSSSVLDRGSVIDSGAALTLIPTNSKRIIKRTIQNIKPFVVKGVGGRGITITRRCSMLLHYTDFKGFKRRFVLPNCYLCDAIRVPLLSASHLLDKGCEMHLTQRGHVINFPNGTRSRMVVQSDGLIGLLPCAVEELNPNVLTNPSVNKEVKVNRLTGDGQASSLLRQPSKVTKSAFKNRKTVKFDVEPADSEGSGVFDITMTDDRFVKGKRSTVRYYDVDTTEERMPRYEYKPALSVSSMIENGLWINKRRRRRYTRLMDLTADAVRKIFIAKMKQLPWMWERLKGVRPIEQEDIVVAEVCNVTHVPTTTKNSRSKPYRRLTDPQYVHGLFNHRSAEVIIQTLENVKGGSASLTKDEQVQLKSELHNLECIACKAVSDRKPVLRHNQKIKRNPERK